jgi:hypothetical protein
MKLISTNIELTASEKIGYFKINQKGKISQFIEEQHIEEARDLLNFYMELKKEGKTLELVN